MLIGSSLAETVSEFFVNRRDTLSEQIICAEVNFTAFIVKHNLPIAVAAHAGPLSTSWNSQQTLQQEFLLYGSGQLNILP